MSDADAHAGTSSMGRPAWDPPDGAASSSGDEAPSPSRSMAPAAPVTAAAPAAGLPEADEAGADAARRGRAKLRTAMSLRDLRKLANVGVAVVLRNQEEKDPVPIVVPTRKLLTATLWLFLFPLALTLIWLSVPLYVNGQPGQNFWLFAYVYHALYAINTTMFGFSLFGLVLPVPMLRTQVFIAICMGGLIGATDTLIRYTYFENLKFMIPAALFPVPVAFFIIVAVYAYNHTLKSVVPLAPLPDMPVDSGRESQRSEFAPVRVSSRAESTLPPELALMRQTSMGEAALRRALDDINTASAPRHPDVARLRGTTGGRRRASTEPDQALSARLASLKASGFLDDPNKPAATAGASTSVVPGESRGGAARATARSRTMSEASRNKRNISGGSNDGGGASSGGAGEDDEETGPLRHGGSRTPAASAPNRAPAPILPGRLPTPPRVALPPGMESAARSPTLSAAARAEQDSKEDEERPITTTDVRPAVRQLTPLVDPLASGTARASPTVAATSSSTPTTPRSSSRGGPTPHAEGSAPLYALLDMAEAAQHPNHGHEHHKRSQVLRSSLLVAQYFRIVLLSIEIIAVYYYCQIFTYYYVTVTKGRVSVQVIMAAVFPWTLFPLGSIMSLTARSVDKTNRKLHDAGREHLRPPGTDEAEEFGLEVVPSVRPVVSWIMSLFASLFQRNLFTNVETIGALALIVLVSLLQDVVLYPVRMTKQYASLTYWLRKKIKNNQACVYIARFLSDDILQSVEVYRTEVMVDFYYTAMAQRVSLVTFAVYLALLRVHNADFYVFGNSDITQNRIEQLFLYCLFLLCVEWTCSTIIWAVIKFFYKKDSVLLGSQVSISSGLLSHAPLMALASPCVLVTIHILQDVYLALNRFNFVGAT